MISELIAITFDKIMQTKSYTMIVLQAGVKKFAIYTDPSIGRTLQLYLTESEKPRPLTHDLIDLIFQGLVIKVKQVVIHDTEDGIYYAHLFLEQTQGEVKKIIEIDARPSDCITLALMHGAPIYCTQTVLEKSIEIED